MENKVEIEESVCNWGDGLLVRESGNIDSNQTSYQTTDYIPINVYSDVTKDFIYLTIYYDKNFSVSSYYSCICAYDNNKNFLQGIKAKINKGYFSIYANYSVKYIRISTNKGISCKIYFANNYNQKDLIDNNKLTSIPIIRPNNYNEVTNYYPELTDLVDNNNLVGEYKLTCRLENNNKFIYNNTNEFSCLLINDIPENSNLLYLRCTESIYVPGVIFFSTDISQLDEFNEYFIGSIFSKSDSQTPIFHDTVINIPNNTKSIVIQAKFGGNNASNIDKVKERLAASFTSSKLISENTLKSTLNDRVDPNYWTGKNIWWCGTSIPAAGYWDINNTTSYPLIVGSILGANRVFNEAVGSSRAAAGSTVGDGSYESVSRRMGDTIERKLEIFNDCWTVDDDEQTVINGPRRLNISSIPTINSYSSACTYRMQILSNCYEIKLIAKYLLKDQNEHDSFLQNKFGSLYNKLIELHPDAYTYQGDIDLFVIDHSNNDTPITYSDINSVDITTYVGALNIYVKLIQKYKPRATVVFISNYTDSPSGVIKTEGDVAANWHVPYCNLLEKIPVGNRSFKISTRGYWDTNHVWHDDGFTWSETENEYTTNLDLSGMSSRVKGDLSLSQVKNRINPRQENGIWYWDACLNDIWMYDGLHPHSDRSFRCLNVYSQAIAGFLKQIGDGKL